MAARPVPGPGSSKSECGDSAAARGAEVVASSDEFDIGGSRAIAPAGSPVCSPASSSRAGFSQLQPRSARVRRRDP
jgi:hypothetical protein